MPEIDECRSVSKGGRELQCQKKGNAGCKWHRSIVGGLYVAVRSAGLLARSLAKAYDATYQSTVACTYDQR